VHGTFGVIVSERLARVAGIEYNPDGTIKRVDLHKPEKT